ncbi:MAG: glycosyl hydrolase family 28-related protein [Brevirhabdus sp.]
MATTNGAVMPPAFEDGLDVWSSEDGTPGSATYDAATNAALVPADQDFGSCLEMLKTDSTQKLRYMGQTPLSPGCYLRIKVRVKAVSGNLPSVRIAGWAADSGGTHVSGLTEEASAVALDTYGKIVTVQAIVGPGARTGVELVWGTNPAYGHFGLDLTGPNGGLLRIENFEIEDVTGEFVRDLVDVVDVRDFGAVGDGVADDSAAFEAADAAALGRTVLVSEGVFHLGSSVTMDSKVRFQGTLSMADASILKLTKSFDLPTYIDAFGDEVLGFKKAFQALLNFVDHEGLDMGGRRIDVDAPIDMQAAVSNRTTWAIRRVIRNGLINVVDSPAWDTGVVTSQASYSASDNTRLTNVANVANIEVGSLVEGNGVGREVYVKSRNVGAQTLTLSQPLYDAVGTQTFTFKRFRYVLDFSGFSQLSKMELDDIEFQLDGKASGILLSPDGLTFHLRDCFITKPKDRGITSIGRGCQGMLIDRCNFTSSEDAIDADLRTTIGMNVNANDVKLRNCRMVRFRHFAVMNGSGHMIIGNHWFQGDEQSSAPRLPGIVLTEPNCKTLITSNYIDNASIEWTNEHDSAPDHSNEYSFGALTVVGNIFTTIGAASWFRWFIVKPYGPGHYIQGLTLNGNVFRTVNGEIDRVELVDDSIASLDVGRFRNISVSDNTYHGVLERVLNPVTVLHDQASASASWDIDFTPFLPFGGECRAIDAVVQHNELRNSSGATVYPGYHIHTVQGAARDQARIDWEQAVSGKAWVTARIDYST